MLLLLSIFLQTHLCFFDGLLLPPCLPCSAPARTTSLVFLSLPWFFPLYFVPKLHRGNCFIKYFMFVVKYFLLFLSALWQHFICHLLFLVFFFSCFIFCIFEITWVCSFWFLIFEAQEFSLGQIFTGPHPSLVGIFFINQGFACKF